MNLESQAGDVAIAGVKITPPLAVIAAARTGRARRKSALYARQCRGGIIRDTRTRKRRFFVNSTFTDSPLESGGRGDPTHPKPTARAATTNRSCP